MKRKLFSLGAALAVLLVVVTLPVSAATSSIGSSGLSITPRKNLIVNPGQTITDKLSVSNLSQDAPLFVNLRMIDFTFMDQTGTPKLFLAQDAPQTTWSLKPFVTLPKSVSVPPGQTRTVNYSVKIPKGQGAGSYYGAIIYSTGSPSGGNVNLSASGVTLMFVSVPGIVKEDMQLQKFGAFQTNDDGATGSYAFINTTEPQWMAFTLKNNGNVAESPSGSITIRNMSGHTVLTIGNSNPNSDLALIGQTRQFVTCMKTKPEDIQLSSQNAKTNICDDPHLKPGKYTADLDLFYGQNGNQTREIRSTATFWYIPWWLIAVAAAIILAIIILILWIRHKIHQREAAKFKAGRRRD